jgi:hypothetical protein
MVTTDVPLLPSSLAVMVTTPIFLPLTRPVELTDASLESDDDQVNARPVIGSPFASTALAVSWSVLFRCTLATDGVTVTVAAGPGVGGGAAVTVIVAVPD